MAVDMRRTELKDHNPITRQVGTSHVVYMPEARGFTTLVPYFDTDPLYMFASPARYDLAGPLFRACLRATDFQIFESTNFKPVKGQPFDRMKRLNLQ